MRNLFKTLMYIILFLFSSMSMAAVEKPDDEAASCAEKVVKHREGPPGKGIVHYGREDCRRVEFAAFERLTADNFRDVAAGHEVRIGKPTYNRRTKN